ncbi:Carboxypeptidase [Nymphaea thermarum]|nr:Carboxypeptidase [Nymphaea thermarum]
MEGGPVEEQSRDHLFGQVYNRLKKDVMEDVDVTNPNLPNLVSSPDDPSSMNEELLIALRKGTRSCTSHPIQRYVSYAKLRLRFAPRSELPRGFSPLSEWVLEISDKPGQEEPEPAFKASIIIKNVHLHLLPTMNPDGFSLKRRGNANNVDLNRDFPDQFFPQNNDEQSRQPETMAIMNWLMENHFTASASLHGGALVANYPWDGSKDLRKQYYACPDDKAFRYMANLYSHFHYNMSQSREFEEGITNGAAWYPIYGGMQDWNYIHGGCFELTLEISDVKWPRAEELPVLWNFNKASMLNLVASVFKSGVHGRIFSALSGQPLPAAVDIKDINYTVKAGQLFGDYHRMLAPGQNYEVTASMPGYFPKTARFSIEDEAVNVDFILNPVVGESRKLKPLENNCKCGYGGMQMSEMMLILTRNHLQVSIAAFAILGFLLFLFRRRINFRIPNSRQLVTHKRALVP